MSYDNFAKCVLFGKCIYNEYEYKFYLNNEFVKADKCSSDIFNTYCVLDGVTYNNVMYESEFIGQYEKKANVYLFHPSYVFVLLLLCLNVFLRILRK